MPVVTVAAGPESPVRRTLIDGTGHAFVTEITPRTVVIVTAWAIDGRPLIESRRPELARRSVTKAVHRR